MANLSIDLLRQIFDYDDGRLVWKESKSPSVSNGDLAGWVSIAAKKGRGKPYLRVQVGNVTMYVHRVIYAMHYGVWPKVIDHIDGDPMNNRIENLRACTQMQNSSNRAISKRNSSGKTGVRQNGEKWQAYIRFNYKLHHLGFFITQEDAVTARMRAEEQMFGEYRREPESPVG